MTNSKKHYLKRKKAEMKINQMTSLEADVEIIWQEICLQNLLSCIYEEAQQNYSC